MEGFSPTERLEENLARPQHGMKDPGTETTVTALVEALGDVQGLFTIARVRMSANLGAVESDSGLLFGSTIEKWHAGAGETIDWLSYLELVTDAGETRLRWLLDVGRVRDCGWRVTRSLERNDMPVTELPQIDFETTQDLSVHLAGLATELLDIRPNGEECPD